MAQEKLTYEEKSNNVNIVDRTKQSTAEDWNEVKDAVNNNADDVDDRVKKVAVDLVAGTDYTQANLHTAIDAIPQLVQLKTSAGVVILDAYLATDQTTGITIINVGANYTNAIFISIGW